MVDKRVLEWELRDMAMEAVVVEVIDSIKNGEIYNALARLRSWLDTASAGDPDVFLNACPVGYKAQVTSLMRDLLSRYPATIIGAPALLFMLGPDGYRTQLPFPTPENRQPCSDLHFMGWAPLYLNSPLVNPYRPEKTPSYITANKVYGSVALFRTNPESYYADEIVIPQAWWIDMLLPLGEFRMHSRMQLPYPDAFEATRVMHAAATDSPYPDDCNFLNEKDWHSAWEFGNLFRETCRHLRKEL